MKLKNYALIAALGTTAIVPANQAQAFFGITCIPRLKNCMCTYLKPCPVMDFQLRGSTGQIKRTEQQRVNHLKESQDKLESNVRSLGGEIGGLIPGINSIGIDIEGLAQAQIDQLTSAIEGIQEQIQGVVVASGDIQSILNGGIDASSIMTSIRESGLDTLDLQNLGISPGAINGLLNNSLNSQQLLDVAGGLNFQGDVLNQLGVTPDTITSIVNGTMSMDDLDGILQDSGLNLTDLSATGIDLSQLDQIAGSLDLTSGLNVINELGIGGLDISSSIGSMKGIVSGDIDSSQIFNIANSVGLSIPNLEQLGVSPDTIVAFQNGGFSASQLLEITRPLGLQGVALEGIGVDAESILSVANGSLTPDEFIKRAQGAGLSINDLSSIGLPLEGIVDISQNGDITSAMSLLENAGLSSNSLAGLGLSGSDIASLSNGSLSQNQISNMIQSAGIDPARIILPGTDGAAINGFGETTNKFTDVINIPMDSIPGLRNALDQTRGINDPILSLSSGDILNSLSTQTGVDLQSQEFMDSLIGGNASSSELMNLMSSQGIGVEQLKSIGVSEESINAMMSGSFDATSLLDFTSSIGLKGQALEGLGIGKTSLESISSGQLSPQQFKDKAETLGISPDVLSGSGLTSESLNQIAQSGNSKVAQQVAAASEGAPVSGISVPVAVGSPLAQVAAAQQTNAFNGPACSPQQTLISTQEEPNFFGDDVAQIDFAIAQGDIYLHEEAVSDAIRLSNANQAHILARSIQIKNILTDALDAIETFDKKIESSENLDDDLLINDAIKIQLLMAQSEVTSLYTFLASSEALAEISAENFTEVATFPHDSEFQNYISESAASAAEKISEPASAATQVSQEFSDFHYQSSKATNGHDLIVRSNKMADAAPGLVESIEQHEVMKAHLFLLEEAIKKMAQPLYLNPKKAADLLLKDLKDEAGSYTKSGKWNSSNNVAIQLDGAFQASNSRYGQRVIVQLGGKDEEPAPVMATAQPYNYPDVDSQSTYDPYDIIRPTFVSEDSPSPPALVGLFQYYLEAFRRESYYGDRRRGVASDTMTLPVWEEFLQFDLQCLTGPIQTTLTNVEARPDLFDLSPSCTHLVWEDGDIEDYIPGAYLGGTDRVLWNNKIERDKILLETGGSKVVLDQAQATLVELNQSRLIDRLLNAGMEGRASVVQKSVDELKAIINNPSFEEVLP
jgi:hypothetical protein